MKLIADTFYFFFYFYFTKQVKREVIYVSSNRN